MRKDLISQKIRTDIRDKRTRNSISPNTISDILEDILNVKPDHTAKSITVTADDIEACVTCNGETLEEQIAQYLNTLNYDDINVNGEVWVEYDDLVVIYVPFTVYDRGRPTPVQFAHGGENTLPVIGDKIYIDTISIGPPTGEPPVYELYNVVMEGDTKASYSLEIDPTLGTTIHLDETTSAVTAITSNYTLIENSDLNGEYYHDGINAEPEVGDTIYTMGQTEGGLQLLPINLYRLSIPYFRVNNGPMLIVGDDSTILSELAPSYKPFIILNSNSDTIFLHQNVAEYPEVGDTISYFDTKSNGVATDVNPLMMIGVTLSTQENGSDYNYTYDTTPIITDKSIAAPSL